MWRSSPRFEVWQPETDPRNVSFSELDRLLDARRWPADFWAAVEEAERASLASDPSWIESGTGRRVATPREG